MENKLIEWILKKNIAAVKGNTENEFDYLGYIRLVMFLACCYNYFKYLVVSSYIKHGWRCW
jgi:hypothetical protein